MTPEQTVRDFFHLMDSKDIDGTIAACTEDVVYANVPVPPMHGREAMRAFLSRNLPRCDYFEGKILHIATSADGRFVMTERLDAFSFNGNRVEAQVMGILEVRDGKIAAWRDYFDVGSFAQKMREAGVEAGPGIAERY